ncbi:PREDICTED: inositol 1,4,5-trisphosphate receptor-interacting protein-like 1, partial [Merops nubicus]|uniref:inositol 1,4,5-trisphosphate receptor-interacting protein-like 1 n=1 Tax=Merops nubicus TaxID=57421 RepID=UPI0004F0A42E
MVAIKLLTLLLQGLIVYPQTVIPGLDEATRERMRQHQEFLSWEMSRLMEELEQSSSAWGDLGFSALQQWQFWAIAAVLLLLLGLCWRLWKWSRELKSRSNEESSSGSRVQEGKQELDEKEKLEEEASEGENLANEKHLKSTFVERIEWPMQKLADGSCEVEELVGELIRVFQELLSCSFFPRLEPEIGPPSGHTFHLEPGKKEGKPERNFCILVELECTCTREECRENMLCFLHSAKGKLRRNQGPSLLDILCTDSHLDVHRTTKWFQRFVSSAWGMVPQTCAYNMKLLPSICSCKLQLTNASGRTLFPCLTSQATEDTFTHGTIWPESYAVAEVKFFRLMASLVGTGFDTYTFKTVVMHVLNTTAPSAWSRRDFLSWLEDIMLKYRCCMEFTCLNHFFFASGMVPKEIILPPDFLMAQPLNLFEYLEQDPVAHAKALEDLELMQ